MINSKSTFFISIIFLLIITFNSGISQSAKVAILALKKLEARCQAGISYNDYSPALGEAKFSVNLFLESNDAEINLELAASIKNIMEHYEMVKPVWEIKLSNGYHRIFFHERIVELLIKIYPEIKNIFEDNSMIYQDNTKEGYIDGDLMLNIIWRTASEELKKATFLETMSDHEAIAKRMETENLRKENDSLRSENSKLRIENDSLIKVRVPLKRKK